MKCTVVFLFFLASLSCAFSQPAPETEIRNVLNSQIRSWNEGNIAEFMKGYWNNDSLMFIGKSGVTYGYQNSLDNYKKHFPDTVAMGKLSFEIVKIAPLSDNHYFVVGKYFLKRTIGDLQGVYTLVFKKINGHWLIISDHSS